MLNNIFTLISFVPISVVSSWLKTCMSLTSTKGNTLIATKVFEKNGFIKIEIALGKGKKDYDKRKKLDEKRASKEIREYK